MVAGGGAAGGRSVLMGGTYGAKRYGGKKIRRGRREKIWREKDTLRGGVTKMARQDTILSPASVERVQFPAISVSKDIAATQHAIYVHAGRAERRHARGRQRQQ